MDRVVVATVTYNSSNYLERLVRALDKQTHSVMKIFVVDNASEEEHRERIEHLSSLYPQMLVIRSENNLGGAGGFELGIKRILESESEYDWIWIMDDDAFPEKECLERLLKSKGLPSAGALCPLIYGVELKKFQLYHHKKKSRYLDKDNIVVTSVETMNSTIEIDANAFVGPLVKREVVEEVGIPDGRLFIYGDDTEYIYRISRRYKVYLVKEAVINHRDVISNKSEFNPNSIWKDYYKYRNRLLFIATYGQSRNQKLIGRCLVIRDCIHEMLSTIKNSRYSPYKKLRIKFLFCAIKDGIRGVNGKTIDPKEFILSYLMISQK